MPKKKKLVDDFSRKEISPEINPPPDEPVHPRSRYGSRRAKSKSVEAPSTPGHTRLDHELAEIYENSDGSMPDMTVFQTQKQPRLWRAMATLLVSCLFLFGVIAIGFFVLLPKQQFSEQDVIVSMSGDTQITAGHEVTYRLRYRNAQSVPLTAVTMQVRYPEGFVLTQASRDPSNPGRDTWDLGSLAPDANGFIDLAGYLYGTVGQKQSFRVFLNYTPQNFHSEFQSVANIPVEIVTAPVLLAVTGGENIVPGRQTTLTISVKPVDQTAISNLAVVMAPNDHFVLKKSVPTADALHANRWSIDSLTGEKSISVTGVFSPGSASSTPLLFQVVQWQNNQRSGDGYAVARQQLDIPVVASPIGVSLAINGTTTDFSVQPGESLNTSVVVKNTSDTVLKHAVVHLIYDAPATPKKKSLLDWSALQDDANGDVNGEQTSPDTRRGSISWRATQIKGLQAIDPGAQVVIDTRLPLRSSGDSVLGELTTHVIQATAEVQFERDGRQELVTSVPIQITVNSDLNVGVSDTKSMEAGKEVHMIQWALNNTFHELKDITLEADAYGDVNWSGNVNPPAGTVSFDPNKKKVVWKIETMPTSVDVFALSFPLTLNSVNPTQTSLMSKVKVQATDTVTGQQILLLGDEVLLK